MKEVGHKRTNVGFHLYEVPRVAKFIETENRIVVTRAWGKEGVESYCLRATVSVWNDEKVLEMDNDNGSPTMWMYLVPNCTPKNG